MQMAATPLPPGSDVDTAALAKLSSGLKRLQLQNLISHSVQNRQPLTLKVPHATQKGTHRG